MFKLRNFKFWNLMPATGLKIIESGAYLPWCSISSSFQNSLKMSGLQSYEFMEFWCWNLVPFSPDTGFQRSSLTYFSFNDAPNVLYRWKIWSVVIAAVCGFALSCWNTQGLPWNKRHLEGSIWGEIAGQFDSPICCCTWGSVGGLVPWSRAPQSWYWEWKINAL